MTSNQNFIGVRQSIRQTGLGLIVLCLLGMTGSVCRAQQTSEASANSLVCYFDVTEGEIQSLQGCRAVSLIGVSLTSDRLSCLAQCEKIGALELQGCLFTHHGIPQIFKFAQLEELSLVGTPIQDEHLPYLIHSPGLTWLDLRGTGVTDQGLSLLAACRSLAYLDLRGTAVTVSAVAELKRRRPDLEILFFAAVRETTLAHGAMR